jgi:hypothetical protein
MHIIYADKYSDKLPSAMCALLPMPLISIGKHTNGEMRNVGFEVLTAVVMIVAIF